MFRTYLLNQFGLKRLDHILLDTFLKEPDFAIGKLKEALETIDKVKKDLRRQPGFDRITFTFCENSNYVWKSCKGKTLLDVVNKLLNTKRLLTIPSNVLPLHLKPTLQPLFEFSLKVRVMRSNPGYLLNFFFAVKNILPLEISTQFMNSLRAK